MLLGAQTYTIRAYTQNERDFRESMRRVAAIGYKTVQLSAIGPIDPHILREVCDENGLQIVLTHTNPDRIMNDPDAVIRDHEIMGCKYIGIGAMAERYRNAAWVERFAKDYEVAAKKIRDAGKLLMYHNHSFEWERLPDGRRIIDVLLEGMPADLMGFTLDTYWVQHAGADLIDWLDILKDRIPCVHFKDMMIRNFEQRIAAVGDGNINFAKVIAKLKENGTTEHILVEQDNCWGESPFDCLERSYNHITKLGY